MARNFKKGTHIIMILPSFLAYGCSGATNQAGQVVIPSNSIVYYDVKITDIQ
jgi:FKBP-type peptidyl-prolyl cis-trans isomerase